MRTALLLAAAALAAPLSAQTAPPPAAPGQHRFDPARFEQKMAEERARRADDIAIVLALKPAQKPALDQWLATMTPPHRDRDADRKGPPPADGAAPGTATERLDREQARLAEHQQRDTQRIDATKRFYASLDPQQQRVFDALDRLRHEDGPHHGFGGMHGGPDGPGDMPPPAARGE